MNRNKLNRLKKKIKDFRCKGGIKSKEIEVFAKTCGRKRHRRGKEPTWINPHFTDLRPLSLPHHTTDLNRFTASSILDQLEEDLFKWEEYLFNIENKEE